MDNTVYTKIYDAPPVDRAEILRYAGTNRFDTGLDEVLSGCLDEILNKLSYKVCYAHLPLKIQESCVDLSFMSVDSSDLSKNLASCKSYILFAATIGIECDRLIARYSKTSPLKALLFQAIGAERIESLCNVFNSEIKEKYDAVPRFSPGYGDLPLNIQKDFFTVLDPYKRIGLCLNKSLLMSPSKSVTAIIGIKNSGEKI